MTNAECKSSAIKTFIGAFNMKFLKALLVSASIVVPALANAAAEKPNFIVILTDDQGYADVGFNGSKDIRTPHIDRIANEGTRFTNGYVTYAVCGPSRAGLLTGRYQGRFGFGRNPYIDPKDTNSGMPLSEQMISEVLKPEGYTSSIIGKWHMGTHPQFHPNNRGFDHFYGFLSGGHRYFPEELIFNSIEEGKKPFDWYQTKLLKNQKRVETDEYLTDELSHEAINFIEQEKDNPFFLYLAYNAPHTPLQATKEYLDRNNHIKKKDRRTYAAMITAVDDGVGRILDKLDELGIDDNTMIFFLSDNGGPTKNASSNAPLRGHKGDYFEGGIRVPFAVRWPNRIPAGVDYNEPVSSLDILATFAAITQAKIAKERPLDGVNLMPFVNGETDDIPHDILFWRNFDQGTLAVRQYNAKAISSDKEGKLLYNLDKDIGEKKNLYKANKRIHKKYTKLMEEWEEELIDPIFKPLQGQDKSNKKSKNKKSKSKKGKGAVPSEVNQLVNGSFDGEDLSMWQAGSYNHAFVTTEETEPYDGVRSAKTKSGNAAITQNFILEDDKQYRVSFWSKWSATPPASTYAVIKYKGKKPLKVNGKVKVPTSTQWTETTYTIDTTKWGGGEHKIAFWKDNSVSFYVDKVEIKELK